MKTAGRSLVMSCVAAMAAIVLVLPGVALGQAFPSRPVKIIVP